MSDTDKSITPETVAASGYPFRCNSYDGSLSRSVTYVVHGFWSGNYLSVCQFKNHNSGEFEAPEISWSSGGRDPKQEPDDTVALECFGKAIAAAVKVARKWQVAKGKNTRHERHR